MRRALSRPALFVVAVTLLGTFLRFHRLSSLAPEAWFDEVWFALRAREMLAAPHFAVFYRTAWGGGNSLMVYFTALAQWLGFTGISSSRLPSAALGALAAPLAYACFCEMFRRTDFPERVYRWIAALAALIASYLLYWVIVSRVGTEPSLAPAATLFCVWQLYRAERLLQLPPVDRKNSPLAALAALTPSSALSFVLVGLVAAIAQYNGPHARFVLPLLGLVALHHVIIAPAPRRAPMALGLGLAAVVGLLVIAPLALFFTREPYWLVARAQITGNRGALAQPNLLLENLRLVLASLNIEGSFDPLTNYPGLPMFDAVQSAGFFIGHAWALWRFRRSPVARELLGWEALMIVPSWLTSDPPNFQRMIGVGAPAAALIAVGWVLALQWIARRLPPRPARVGVGLAVLAIAFSPLYQMYVLLVRFPQWPSLPLDYLAVPVKTARELIARADAGERVFVSRNPEDDDVISFEFLFPGTPVGRLDFRQCLPLGDGRAARSNYLVLTRRDRQSVLALYDTYPGASITEYYLWQDSGTLIEVPPLASGPVASHPGRAAFAPGLTFTGHDWSGPTVRAGESLFLTLYWKVEVDLRTDYTSFLHVGTGLGGAPVVAQNDHAPCQGLFLTSRWRAGDLIRDSFAVTIPPDTPPGDYPIVTGWYTYPSLTRLTLLNAGNPLPDNRAIIGVVTVTR